MMHDPFDCQMLVEVITDWLEGVLPEPTRSQLELHIRTCPGCIAYIEQMRWTRATLERLASVERIEPAEPGVRDELLAVFRARRR
jgi:anti-sigma factor RsiW